MGEANSDSDSDDSKPRLDRGFIDQQRLLERYLDGELPYRGARDFERWCAEHPQYLAEHRLAQRTQATLRLLDAAGRAPDLAEPPNRWWRGPWFAAALATVALASLLGLWALSAHDALLRDDLARARARLAAGPMQAPGSIETLRATPDRAPTADAPPIRVDRSPARLIDLRIEMGYVRAERFRVVMDEQGAGRALVLERLEKDSNGELRITFNSSVLAPGRYAVRVEALPVLGRAVADGWFVMDLR